MMGWEIVFWSLLGLLGYVFLGYPGVLLFLARFKTQPVGVGEAAAWPRVSLVIPAHDEEDYLAASLENKLHLNYPPGRLEVIVVSDGSTDRTAEIVNSFRNQGVRLVALPERRGAGGAIDAGIAAAQNEIIVTTDANTDTDPDMVKNLVRHFSDPTIGGVSGDKCIRPSACGQVQEQDEHSYWAYENRLRESEFLVLGTALTADNANFAFRKSIFTDPCPSIVGHDYWLALYITRKGYRLAFDRKAVVYETYTPTLEVDFKRKVRVILGGLQAVALFPDLWLPWRRPDLAFQLCSHKILRWLAALMMLGVLGSNLLLLGSPFYRLLLALQILFYAVFLLGVTFRATLVWKPVKLITYFVSVNFASLVAFFRFAVRERNWKPFWEKARG